MPEDKAGLAAALLNASQRSLLLVAAAVIALWTRNAHGEEDPAPPIDYGAAATTREMSALAARTTISRR